MPVWPVNQRMPSPVEGRGVEVGVPAVGRQREDAALPRSRGSTRTIAFRPPSVIHGAPSGPTITPCGAEPAPRAMRRGPRRSVGSSQPSCAGALRRVPDAAVARRRDVVRVRPARDADTRGRGVATPSQSPRRRRRWFRWRSPRRRATRACGSVRYRAAPGSAACRSRVRQGLRDPRGGVGVGPLHRRMAKPRG